MSFKSIPFIEMVDRVIADVIHKRTYGCPDPYGDGCKCPVCLEIAAEIRGRFVNLGWLEVQ